MEHATQVSVSAHGSSNGSSSGLSSGGTSSRTSSSTNLGSAAAFTNGDDFGTFATPALSPPAAPVTSDSYAEMFGALSSSSSSLEPPPPLSAFSQSALSEISFADDEYDSPFADIVNEPPKSANASRNNSFSHSGMAFEPLQQQPAQASAGGIEMGSPLLSFSPVATPSTLSMAPSASSLPDIFSSPACVASVRVDMFSLSTKSVSSAPAEAELLSFSPLALSSSAGSQKKPTPRFSLPPPRAVTMPSQSPGAVSSTKAASFSGQVSVGELLSFSPVASAPLSSFSGSLGGSSAAAAASIFDDDELFSLSTGGLAIDFSTSAADPYPVAASPSSEISPVSFGDSMIQDFTVNQSSASMEIKSPAEEVGSSTLVAESEVQVVDAKEEECAFPGQQEDDGEALEQQSPVSGELHILSEERVHAELKELQHSGSDDDSSAGDEESRGSIAGVATETVEATQDAQRLSIPSPVGYSQFEFITQDFSPQASQSDEQAGSSFDEENGDKALERELSAENSPPSDTDQYQPFSQDSDGDQYTSLGDLSEEGFGGSAASPAHSQEFKRLHELRSTSGAPEPAHKPIGHEDSSEALEYASFSSSGSGERGFQADVETSAGVQQSGVDRESALSTSPTAGGAGEFQATDVQGFGALSASKSSAESTTNGEYGDEDTNDARDDGFSDFGAPPNAELAVQTGFSGFQTCANVASATDGGDDEFGGFSASPTSQPDAKSFQATSATSFPANVDTRDDFGGFSSGSFGGDDAAADDFGDFAQSSNPVDGGADDDAFGDFGQSSSAVGDDDDDAFAGFGQSSSSGFEANAPFSLTDDDFGDFNGPAVSAAPSAFVAVTTSSSITTLLSSKHELVHFFSQAFPVYSTPTPLDTGLHVPAVASHTSKELFQDKVCICSMMQIAAAQYSMWFVPQWVCVFSFHVITGAIQRAGRDHLSSRRGELLPGFVFCHGLDCHGHRALLVQAERFSTKTPQIRADRKDSGSVSARRDLSARVRQAPRAALACELGRRAKDARRVDERPGLTLQQLGKRCDDAHRETGGAVREGEDRGASCPPASEHQGLVAGDDTPVAVEKRRRRHSRYCRRLSRRNGFFRSVAWRADSHWRICSQDLTVFFCRRRSRQRSSDSSSGGLG